MPGKNPPRKTNIRGQRHLLAYITPDEAALLKARGGTGELHKGIPSYPPSERDSSGRDTGRGREGGGERSGMRDDSDRSSRKTFDSGYTVSKSFAEKKLTEQIAKGKKNISNMSFFDKVIAGLVPGAGFATAQNFAAQFMGGMMKDVLSQPGSRAVVDPKSGRVVGAYNASGQLTGRDPERDRARAAAADARGGGQDRVSSFAAVTDEEEKPTLAKKVIRTDLAKEIEQERTQRRKAGVSQLSRRSLLSNVSRLGA